MNVSMICVAVLGLLVVGLGLCVSMQRRNSRVSIGLPDDLSSPLLKFGRAHANTAEYAPILALMIYALGAGVQPMWVVALMVLATVSRVIFVCGMIFTESLAKPNRMRFLGALGTYVFGVALALVLLVQSF